MKPDTVNIHHLFASRRRYCVPIYQRHYVWSEQGQWSNLWEDLHSKARSRLAGKADRYPHYMGALVLEQRGVSSSREVPVVDVIDGQQRLTTLQILLAALRDVARMQGANAMARLAERCILNEHPEEMREPDVEVYKLWPTYHDREVYLAILTAGSRAEVRKRFVDFFPAGRSHLTKFHRDKQPRLLQAYIFFHDAVEAFVAGDDGEQLSPEQIEARLDALLTALREDFRVVEIQLEPDDDAQVIFETLNDRGTPLLASDLIRNYIFLRASREKALPEKLYEARWRTFEDPFWSAPETRGRLTRPRMEFFLLQYLGARTGAEVSLIRLFAEYKAFVEGREELLTVDAEIADILRFAPHYRTLSEATGTGALAHLARRLRPWEVGPAYAPVLAIAASDLAEDAKAQAYNDIMSYVIRRAICERGNKNYNNVFFALTRALAEHGTSPETVRAFLLAQKGESTSWPNDAEFEFAWLEKPLYRQLTPVARMRSVLEELELGSRTAKVDPAPLSSDLWVEHFMPQSWQEHWPLRDGSQPTLAEVTEARLQPTLAEAAGGRLGEIARRERLLHTVGNLTLHTASLGASAQNGPFAAKQAAFRANALFHLTKGLTAPEIASWDEDSIRARSAALFAVARKVWPYPSQESSILG